jgi:hypothetical protein
VHAPCVRRVLRGVILEENDVRGKRGPPVDSFEEVVAGERVLRDATFDAPHERVDVVNAFANINPRAEEVLIQLGDGVRVDVEPDVAGEDPCE